MKIYRIEREKYLKTTLQGIGAAFSEGSDGIACTQTLFKWLNLVRWQHSKLLCI